MRKLIIGTVVVALASGGPADAAQKAQRTARSVQLIRMATRAPDGRLPTQTRDGTAPATEAIEASISSAADFRVHDLSRRWVEFQMANSFAVAAPGSSTPGGSPFSRTETALPVPAMEGVPSVAESMSIPLWMRGGDIRASIAAYVSGCALPAYRPSGFLRSEVETRRAGYYGLMGNIACEYGIPVGLFDAMIIRESQYQPYIYSSKSAFGLTQLMPGTAAALGVNRYDIEGNLRGGAKYLRQQLDRFGHYHLALAAYNAGPGRVRNGLVPRIAETQAYVDNVLLNWSRLAGLSRTATVASGTSSPRQRVMPRFGRVAAVSTF